MKTRAFSIAAAASVLILASVAIADHNSAESIAARVSAVYGPGGRRATH